MYCVCSPLCFALCSALCSACNARVCIACVRVRLFRPGAVVAPVAVVAPPVAVVARPGVEAPKQVKPQREYLCARTDQLSPQFY